MPFNTSLILAPAKYVSGESPSLPTQCRRAANESLRILKSCIVLLLQRVVNELVSLLASIPGWRLVAPGDSGPVGTDPIGQRQDRLYHESLGEAKINGWTRLGLGGTAARAGLARRCDILKCLPAYSTRGLIALMFASKPSPKRSLRKSRENRRNRLAVPVASATSSWLGERCNVAGPPAGSNVM